MAASSSACPSSTTVPGSASDTEAIQLENVVRRAHQRPFALHLLESPQQELPEATGLLDLADHWFDDSFARGIDRRAVPPTKAWYCLEWPINSKARGPSLCLCRVSAKPEG